MYVDELVLGLRVGSRLLLCYINEMNWVISAILIQV